MQDLARRLARYFKNYIFFNIEAACHLAFSGVPTLDFVILLQLELIDCELRNRIVNPAGH